MRYIARLSYKVISKLALKLYKLLNQYEGSKLILIEYQVLNSKLKCHMFYLMGYFNARSIPTFSVPPLGYKKDLDSYKQRKQYSLLLAYNRAREINGGSDLLKSLALKEKPDDKADAFNLIYEFISKTNRP